MIKTRNIKKCFGQIVDENFVFGMSLGEENAALVFQFGHIVKLLDLSLNDKIVKAKEH